MVVRYCCARVGRRDGTFAAAEQVCLVVLTALSDYRDQGRPFLAFVYGIAAHKVAATHRATARNRSESFETAPHTDPPAARRATPTRSPQPGPWHARQPAGADWPEWCGSCDGPAPHERYVEDDSGALVPCPRCRP
ncbi:hypothetical protein GCM10010428_78290 [Actinosynnema pretiosum subsp. pretiosum]